MKSRSDLTQDEALVLVHSDQMQIADYFALCEEKGWDKSYGLTPQEGTLHGLD